MNASNREWLPIALDLVRTAERRLYLAEYVIYDGGNVGQVLDGVIDAAARGVDTRVLADEEGSGTAAALSRLQAAGVDARLDDPSVTTHNKLLVADDAVLVGSTNLTDSAIASNNEGDLYVTVPEVATFYADYFLALQSDPAATPDLTWTGSGPVTPYQDRQVRGAWEACLQGAREEIAIVLYAMMYYPEYPTSSPTSLVESLVAAHDRGVAVRVILDGSDWILENHINDDALAYLQARGIDVRRTPSTVTTHAKVATCDQRVFVSDANWSQSALDEYHGTSVAVEDPDVAASFRAWFMDIWDSATP